LKARQLGRGDTAQIKRGEQTLERLDEIEGKLDKIMDHLSIETQLRLDSSDVILSVCF
jgi:hypothetical protein